MNATQAWQMLAARGVRMEGARGGRPTLTASDVARLLHGLERGPFLMGMAKETGDVAHLAELEQLLEEAVWSMAVRWPVSDLERRQYVRRLAGLAVLETLVPRPLPCSRCVGRGYRVLDHQAFPCNECGQTGGQTLPPYVRARLAGIPWTSWRRSWVVRYERVHALACGWHSDALGWLARNLNSAREAAC